MNHVTIKKNAATHTLTIHSKAEDKADTVVDLSRANKAEVASWAEAISDWLARGFKNYPVLRQR